MLTQRSEKELLPPPRAARTQGAAAEAEVHEIMFSASQPTLAALGSEWKRGLWFSLGLGKGEGHSRKRLAGKEAESEQAAVRGKDS